jgi:hypothetical protein
MPARGLSELLDRVEALDAGRGAASIGILADGRQAFATAGGLDQSSVPLGCLMKPMTALLAAQEVYTGRLRWEDEAIRHLDLSANAAALLQSISIRQLLNHTHGLDDSSVESVPLLADGRIAVETLSSALAAQPRLAAPGEHYSYGNAGTWICAAVLEAVTGRRYGELLSERILAYLGRDARLPEGASVCPARDQHFSLSAPALLSFLAMFMDQQNGALPAPPAFDRSVFFENPRPFEGWSPGARGICVGWLWFGDGWFGYNSQSGPYSVRLRLNATTNVGIVFWGMGAVAFSNLALLFGDVLPEFSRRRLPRFLPSPVPAERYEGTYVDGTSSIEIREGPSQQLSYQLTRHGRRPTDVQREPQGLRAAADHLFIPQTTPPTELPFMQFLAPDSGGRFAYLWNGWALRRRCAPGANPHPYGHEKIP